MIRHPAANIRSRRRRGLTSVVMLIGLLVLGIVAANLLRVERSRLDRARTEERVLQAEALADAGVDRALAQLRANPGFAGETWEPTADDLGGLPPARVTSTVRPDPGSPAESRVIAVTAELRLSPDRLIHQSRTLPWRSGRPQP